MTEAKPKAASDLIIIRPARLWEGKRIGEIAAKTYRDTPLTRFLSPHKDQYYSDYERGFQYRAQTRMLKANSQTFVACEASNPSHAIGFAQFGRLGDDAGYKAQMKKRDTYWLKLLAFVFYYWTKLNLLVRGGDRSRSENGEALFMKYSADEERLHWSLPERKNRWEAMSVVILEEYQGRGVGKILMKKVIDMAEDEGVYVGLAASTHGVFLYKSVGFELLAPFQNLVHADDGGGVMLYTPSSLRKEKAI